MKAYYKFTITSILCLLLFSCQSPDTNSNSISPSIPKSNTEEQVIENINSETNIATVDEQLLISSQGIGDAQVGITYGELKNKLGDNFEFQVVSPFMVDIDAIAVSQSGKVQYYLLYLSSDTFDDNSIIEIIMTENSKYSTAEGITVGTSIKKVEQRYGQATFSYNINNESREYVEFAQQPASNILFRPTANNYGFAGIYNEPIQEYNQTKIFEDNAVINQIQVFQNN